MPDRDRHGPACHRSANWRSLAFAVGDSTFLVWVGALAVVAMQLTRKLEWNAFLCSLLGMALAMAIQTALAFLVSPLLGSIESMTPSMVVAMVTPMLLEALEMIGMEIGSTEELIFGGGCGFLAFLVIRAYGVSCERNYRRRYGAL